MSRDDKKVYDKYVAKTNSVPYDKHDETNTPERYTLNHATPSTLT